MSRIEYYIDDEPCTGPEFASFQFKTQLLYGNTYTHQATMADGTYMCRAISPSRVQVAPR